MWKYFILYFYLVTLSRGNDNADTYQERNKDCCEQGVAYARKYHATYQDCWFIIPEKPETLLCKLNKQHCCLKESVKMACSYGIRIAMDNNQCNSTRGHAEQFCKECVKGKAAGSRGEMCEAQVQSRGNSVFFEKMLTDTFNQCCQKAADNKDERTESQTTEQNKHESASRKPSESDIGDCANGKHVCDANESCLETNGSFQCHCKLGFKLDNTTGACIGIGDCAGGPQLCDENQYCLETNGIFRCRCDLGFEQNSTTGACFDTDECATGDATCAKEETNGDSTDICINTVGGYRCHRIICPTGYKLRSTQDKIGRCDRIKNPCPAGDLECAHQPIVYFYQHIAIASKIPDSKVNLLTMLNPGLPNVELKFSLRLIDVHAPRWVKDRASINHFLVTQKENQEGVLSVVHTLEGPQTVELELSMEINSKKKNVGTIVNNLALFISEYEYEVFKKFMHPVFDI